MKLAIHDRPGSWSDRWITVCRNRGIDHIVIDCHDSDVMQTLGGVDGLLWHYHHEHAASMLAALPVLVSAQSAGLAVFPDASTAWHFDNKIAQKYLLEAHKAPIVPTWVFYDESTAMRWIAEASFPKVFKLTCGAASQNVRLVRTRADAVRLAEQAFGKGFIASTGYFADLKRKLTSVTSWSKLVEKMRRAPRSYSRTRHIQRSLPLQRGYLYFQEFMANNDHDTRVTVIGDRAFGFTRGVRPGDFRASGSGRLALDPQSVDRRCVEIAFKTARALGAQSVAFDFVKASDGSPFIVEISYAYLADVVHDCPGHWNADMLWQEGHVWPQDAVLDDLIAQIRSPAR